MAQTVMLLRSGGIGVSSKDNGGVNQQTNLMLDLHLFIGRGDNILCFSVLTGPVRIKIIVYGSEL
jgi:hypothetical protein